MKPADLSRPAERSATSATGSATGAKADFIAGVSRSSGDEARWRKFAWLVVGLAVALYFARLGTRALWSSEFRWAEIAREMQLTSNYFWPTINGHPYYDKPLGTYWLVVASTWVTGGMNETAARLPCAIAGTLGIVLLISIGQRLYDLKTGVVAGLVLATSFSFVFFSRTASADVETVTGELVALMLFLRHERRQDGWWVVPLWIVMAVTSLMKGLLGFVLPLLVIGSYCMLAEGWAELGRVMSGGSLGDRWRWIVKRNRWFFNWKTPAAIAIGGLLYYIPFAVSHVETGTTTGIFMVYRENVKRFFEPFDHRGPVYLYTYVIFALMAPWSALLPAALVNAHGRRHPDPDDARSDRFTMVFFWATFVFFTLSGSRRSYYLLPILPAAAILIARLLERTFEQMTPATRMLTKIGFGVIAGAAILSAVAFVPPRMVLPEPYSKLPPVPDLGIFAMFWIGSIGAIFYAMRDFSTRRILVACGAIAWLFMFYLYVFAMPAGDAYRGEEAFAAQTRAIIGNDEAGLALFRNQGPVYYLGLPRPIPKYSRLGELNDAVSDHKVQWLIVRRRDLPLLKFKSALVAAEATYPWDSEQHHLNSMVLLHIAPPQ